MTWILLDLGARGALVDEADRLLAAARLGEHAAVADLVLRVQQSYFQLLAARALLDAESAVVKQAEASLAAAEGRQRAGLATLADVLQARTALSQIRLAQQQAEGQALAARGALATLAGLSPTAELEVGRLPEAVDAASAQPAVDDLLAAAAARNPDLGRARATAEAAQARARAAGRAAWPVLAFQGGASRAHYLDPTGAGRRDLLVRRAPAAAPHLRRASARPTKRWRRARPRTRRATAPTRPGSGSPSTSGPPGRRSGPRAAASRPRATSSSRRAPPRTSRPGATARASARSSIS